MPVWQLLAGLVAKAAGTIWPVERPRHDFKIGEHQGRKIEHQHWGNCIFHRISHQNLCLEVRPRILNLFSHRACCRLLF